MKSIFKCLPCCASFLKLAGCHNHKHVNVDIFGQNTWEDDVAIIWRCLVIFVCDNKKSCNMEMYSFCWRGLKLGLSTH